MGVLLDIDGTVLDRGEPIAGAVEAISTLRDLGVPLLFATNTSRKSRSSVAASLRDAGVPAAEEDVLSASYAAAVRLRTRDIRRVHLLLTPDAMRDWADFERTEDAPQAVVVGDMGTSFDFERLNGAFRSLHGGAALIATQKNRFWKAPDGLTLDAGAFVAALEYAARTSAEVVGKPTVGFFHMAAELLREDPTDLTIVGDDLESDVAGGHAAGLRTCLVRTGKFDAARLEAAPPDRRPHHVIDSIAALPNMIR